jgi:hypothetical protein
MKVKKCNIEVVNQQREGFKHGDGFEDKRRLVIEEEKKSESRKRKDIWHKENNSHPRPS